MKLQDLNRSFTKVLAAVAIAFMISAAPAQAQGQWGADRCYYAVQNGQMVRQGCMQTGNLYRDYTNVITDLQTGQKFFQGQNGRMLILTTAGWVDAQAYVAQVAAAKQARDPNFAATYGTGTVGGVYVGTGSMTLKGPSLTDTYGRPYPDSASGVAIYVDGANQRQINTTLSPNCSPGATGGRGCYVYAH